MGGIPGDTTSVTPDNSAHIIYFKTADTINAGDAVRINGDMKVEQYTSGGADTCVGISLSDAIGSDGMEELVPVQVSGIMKVPNGILKSDFSDGVAGDLCEAVNGTITSRDTSDANDQSDFIIVHGNDSSGAAYVMWLKGSIY